MSFERLPIELREVLRPQRVRPGTYRNRVQRPDLFTETMAGMIDGDAESWRLLMRRV